MKRTTLRIDDAKHKSLVELAEANHMSINDYLILLINEKIKNEKSKGRKLDNEWKSIYENTKEERFVELKNGNVGLQNSINLVFEELTKQNEALLSIIRRGCIIANLTGEMSEQILPLKNGRSIVQNAIAHAEKEAKKFSLTLRENYDDDYVKPKPVEPKPEPEKILPTTNNQKQQIEKEKALRDAIQLEAQKIAEATAKAEQLEREKINRHRKKQCEKCLTENVLINENRENHRGLVCVRCGHFETL